MEKEIGKTSTSKIWLSKDGILVQENLFNTMETLETAKENVEMLWKVAGHKKRPVLVDPTEVLYVEDEARNYYAFSDKSEQYFTAVAILTKTTTAKIIGNFMISVNKPKAFPVKLFSSEKDAIEWLKNYV